MASDNTGEPTIPTDRKDPYWDKSNPKHAEAISAMSKRFSQRFPEATPAVEPSATPQPPNLLEAVQPDLPSEAEAREYLREEMPLEDLRARAGVYVQLPAGYEFDEVHEAQYLAYVVENAIPAQTAQHVLSWYADKMILSMGEVGDADYDEFREKFKGSLTPAQIELLVRWHKTEVMGGEAAPQTKHR